jgi:signal transduction histidine kinase
MESVLSLKDSVYQQNSEEELASLKTKYNQQKQENLIIQQKLDLSRKNTVIYGGITFSFFGVVIAGLLFYNYRRKQRMLVESVKEEETRKRQAAIQEAAENERKRISADLHDNLGAYASAISANADDLMADDTATESLVHNIKSNADAILNSLNETIWVLNKAEINLTSLCDRFKTYVARIRSSYPDMFLNINENITEDRRLSPEAALNMLRIMQEAFHNAIKHSKGDCITVDISGGAKIEIIISDNGQGIVNTFNMNGHGIQNMEKRAKANGWQLSIVNGNGTRVKLST